MVWGDQAWRSGILIFAMLNVSLGFMWGQADVCNPRVNLFDTVEKVLIAARFIW